MSGQVELNPGPMSKKIVKFPCGICENEVKDEHKGISCDSCSTWYHNDCTGMSDYMYDTYCNHSNLSWLCIRCGFPNVSTGIFDSTLLSTSNSFEVLDSSDSLDFPSSSGQNESFVPTQSSTPIKDQKRTKTSTQKLKARSLTVTGYIGPNVKLNSMPVLMI
jgi:hypothetical protein